MPKQKLPDLPQEIKISPNTTEDMDEPEWYNSDLIRWCNKNNIKHFPIKVTRGKKTGKKGIRAMRDCAGNFIKEYKKRKADGKAYFTNVPRETDFLPPGIDDKGKPYGCTPEEIKARHKHYGYYQFMAIDTNDIKQIDCDSPFYDQRVKELEMNHIHYLSLTKKLPHIFVKMDKTGNGCCVDAVDDKRSSTCVEGCRLDCEKHKKKQIEILQGKFCWAHIHAEIINPDLPIAVIDDVSEWVAKQKSLLTAEEEIKEEQAAIEKKVGVVDTAPSPRNIQKWLDYADIIQDDYWDIFSYEAKEGFMVLLMSAKNIGIPYDKFDKLAKMKGTGYNKANNKKLWDDYKPNKKKKGGVGYKWNKLFEIAEDEETGDMDKFIELESKYVVFERFFIATFDALNDNVKESIWERAKARYYKNEDDKMDKILEKEMNAAERAYLKSNWKMKKKYFEKFHFKIMNPMGVGRRFEENIEIFSKASAKEMMQNIQCKAILRNGKIAWVKFLDNWLDQSNVKTYEKVDFCPSPLDVTAKAKSTFNLFNGFAAEHHRGCREDADIEVFLQHIRLLGGKSPAVKGLEPYEFLLCYLAHMIQFPGIIAELALAFIAAQGTGKSTFWENFGKKILGIVYTFSTANIDHIIGRFAGCKHKLLVVMDETQGSDTFMNNTKVKNFITQPHVQFEPKHKSIVELNNCSRMIFLGNPDSGGANPVTIELSDRRFAIFHMNPVMKGNDDYFDKLIAAFNDPDRVWSFYNFLKNYDLSNFNMRRDRCLTKEYYEIQASQIPILWRFLSYKVKVPPMSAWSKCVYDSDSEDEEEEVVDGSVMDSIIKSKSQEEWEEMWFNKPFEVKSSVYFKSFKRWLSKYSNEKKQGYASLNAFGRAMRKACTTWGEDAMIFTDRSSGKHYTLFPMEIRKALEKYKEFIYS